jgi:hypothetical protein
MGPRHLPSAAAQPRGSPVESAAENESTERQIKIEGQDQDEYKASSALYVSV